LGATTVGYLEETCVSYIEAQLLLTTRYQDTANQQERSGHVPLWAANWRRVGTRPIEARALDAGGRARRPSQLGAMKGGGPATAGP